MLKINNKPTKKVQKGIDKFKALCLEIIGDNELIISDEAIIRNRFRDKLREKVENIK